MRTRRMKLRRTRRIKGGHLWWNNPYKSDKNNKKDCKRWNSNKECSDHQTKMYYYPGRTNRGRIPTLKNTPKKKMTKDDWCEAVPHIGERKLNYLNTRLNPEFDPIKSCKPPPTKTSSNYISFADYDEPFADLENATALLYGKQAPSKRRLSSDSSSESETDRTNLQSRLYGRNL